MSKNFEEILQRLMNGGAQELAASSIEHLLIMPISEVIDAKVMTRVLNQTIGATLAQEAFRDRIIHLWTTMQEESLSGSVQDYIPERAMSQIRGDLDLTAAIDEQLLQEMMNHPAVERIFRSVLNETLLGFTDGLKQMGTRAAPKSVGRGIGRLRSMGDRVLRETPLSGFAQMLEQQAQNRISTYLDQSISQIIESSVSHLCDPINKDSHQAFQQHVLDLFLSRDVSSVVNDLSGVVTADKINTWMELVAELITAPAFTAQIEEWIERQMNQYSELSVSAFLAENGVDVSGAEMEEIKNATSEILTSAMLSYLSSETGRDWVVRILQ